jgi:serine phosphatase RsbU (regulator of sigma subunit)
MEVVIGRKGDVDIVLANQHISRRHARIVKMDEGHFLVDLESTHGTFVNDEAVQNRILRHGDKICLGRDRVEIYYFVANATLKNAVKAETTRIIERSLVDLDMARLSEHSDLEKISFLLDFQYQWEQMFTPDAAFHKILESVLKISGGERAFIMVKEGTRFGYAMGLDGKGKTLSQRDFQMSNSVVNQVVADGQPVFMVEELQDKFKNQASIVAMNLRAIACLPLYGIRSGAEKPEVLGIVYLDSTKKMHSLSGLDQKIIGKLAVEAGTVLERIEMIKSIEQRKKMEQELALAEETQRGLLPQRLPVLENLRIHAFSKPTRYVGGDFYDFLLLDSGLLIGILGDVAGKGVSASLLSAMVVGCLEIQLRTGSSQIEAVYRLNKFLCDKASRFATMFLFTLNPDCSGRFLSAGHNPAYLYRCATREIEELGSNNMIVGAFAFAEYADSPVQLVKGDVLVIYSDGLTEAENQALEMLGEERVKDIIRTYAADGAEDLAGKLLDTIQVFTEGQTQTDDITIAIIERI